MEQSLRENSSQCMALDLLTEEGMKGSASEERALPESPERG